MFRRICTLLAILATVAACSSNPVADTTAPSSTGSSTDAPVAVPGGFDFDRVRLMESSELPEGVPVPVPAGGEINETLSVSEGQSLFVDYDPRFLATAVAFYETWFDREGLEATPKFLSDAAGWDISIDGQPVEVLVQLSDDGAETQLSILWP